ncbi:MULTISPECIES: filamentous hemagglutinin N-terminal domain-containing protein [unclassified Coleofasciculus]|uniref:filamentous hemagglutinin N-terminal domain-containing protein n=1 Tax=unclassified Coleofasciculus TaxID=2692782 RepID=UPI001882F413|nr:MULTISPECIES: filamentous hemagglutinin N-terminal domain-containing protein [unclassified Coleofasciculus]MBE9127782.1 filamentous hemagglutinin N-terminal domain-containing protein [Coleofasciculus sp. LEGE 07081]MBE9148583.1 filamentous hemagglutinin N-terminal domain-containing protein [Coleofasciculus sp. LEGE 07092]
MSNLKKLGFSISIATALLSLGVGNKPTSAQSIKIAPDGAGTIVTQDGQEFIIDGGLLSGDGSNLFHSFEKFGLSQEETANFLSNPQIRNILGRVVGGEASLINGLIQVTGGNSNLFLMNPAGIVFGDNASLNVPAAFTATTASSIGFEGGQFNAVGDNSYNTLMGSPTNFSFAMEQPGSIVNAGDLAVGEGQSLTVAAGQVINTGTFSAPGGNITVASVPGTSQVVINQDGMALGLKLDVAQFNDNGIGDISPASLAQLVTGGTLIPATEIQVDDQGQVWLTASNQPIPTESGTAVVSGTFDASKMLFLGERVTLVDVEISKLLIEAIGGPIEVIGELIIVGSVAPGTNPETPNTDTSGETPGGVIVIDSGTTDTLEPGTDTDTPDTGSETDSPGETPETDADTSDSDTANSGTNTTDTKIIGDNGRTINIGSTDSSISPVVNNVVNPAIQSINRTSPSLPLTLQPSEVDPILEWTGNIVQDSLRANNFNRNRGLEAMVNTQRHWDNFLEAVKTKDAIGITHQRISDAVINQMQTDIGQEINPRYCSSARNGVDCEEEKVNP